MRRYSRPAVAVPYGIAIAIAVAATTFFGWAGFWLGVAVIALVKVGRWGIPLIKLSYAPPSQRADDEPAP